MTSRYLSENYYRSHINGVNPLKLRLSDMFVKARLDTGIDFIILGMKKNDSLSRRLTINRLGELPINFKNKTCFPLSDWTDKMCLSYIQMNKLPNPIQYEHGKRSQGMDLNSSFINFLRNKWPQDYQKLLEIFPHAEAIK